MKPTRPTKSKALQPPKSGFDGLLRELREFIAESRRQVLRAVDVVQASLSLITLAMIAARAVNILG